MKTRFAIATVAGILLLPIPRALAASPSGAALVIRVAPEAYARVESPLAWNATGEIPSLLIPLQVLVRLNPGTYGQLRISLADQSPGAVSPLEAETAQGIERIASSPLLIRTYDRSGTYSNPVMIRQSRGAEENLQPVSLQLNLSASDGAAEWSQTVILPPAVLPGAQNSVSPDR